jgi:hypothetical protein
MRKISKADWKMLKSWFKEIISGIAGALVFHNRLITPIIYFLMVLAASRDPKYKRLWKS